MKKTSMQDIAKELSLSITTVSFVLNGKAAAMGISEATVKKVTELIENRGYKPNSIARVLRTGKSHTIALIIEDIGNHFFGNIAKFIEIIANKNGYKVFFCSTENNNDMAKDLISIMKQSAVDGFIITPTIGLEDELDKLKKENIPFILIDRLLPEIDVNYVVVDNFWGSYQLIKHLLDFGYKNIGLVSIINSMSTFEQRKKGYLSALSDNNIPINTGNILELDFDGTNSEMAKTIQQYLNDNKNIDALFFTTNYLGILGIEAIQLNNLQIGKDIAVVCFDDNDAFKLISPPITVASQPIKEIAVKAVELLLKNMRKGKKAAHTIGEILKPEIIIRQSSPRKVN